MIVSWTKPWWSLSSLWVWLCSVVGSQLPEQSRRIAPEMPLTPSLCSHLSELLENVTLIHKPVSLQPRGLINKGNWCYINAVSFSDAVPKLAFCSILFPGHVWLTSASVGRPQNFGFEVLNPKLWFLIAYQLGYFWPPSTPSPPKKDDDWQNQASLVLIKMVLKKKGGDSWIVG